MTSPDGRKFKFHRDTKGPLKGFPYITLDKFRGQDDFDPVLINTVRKNMEGMTSRKIKEAYVAAEARQMVGNPSVRKFREMVSSSNVPNCPARPDAIADAVALYGPHDLPSVKGQDGTHKAKQGGRGATTNSSERLHSGKVR